MTRTKYIVIEDENIIIFPETLVHKEVADKFGNVIRAGFCQIFTDGSDIIYHCFGRSDSLNLESDVEMDSYLLQNLFERR